jgi:adenine/guanine phosphoribosyltransferase-like PRPP-binding protein
VAVTGIDVINTVAVTGIDVISTVACGGLLIAGGLARRLGAPRRRRPSQ